MNWDGLPLDKLMSAAENPQVGANAASLTSMLKEGEELLKFAEKIIALADRAGALPGLVRALGKKYGVDVERPLGTANTVAAPSAFHKELFERMAAMTEAQLNEAMQNAAARLEAGKPGDQEQHTT